MKRLISIAVLVAFALPAAAQIDNGDLPNSFTDQSVIPHGCLTVIPSVFDPPPAVVDHDETLNVTDEGNAAVVRIRAWRIGCHEPGRSAIVINFKLLSGSPEVRYPRPVLYSQDALARPVGLFHFGRSDYYDRNGLALTPMTDQSTASFVDGVTMVVDAHADRITAQKYNSLLVLRLEWASGDETDISIPNYDEFVSVPQLGEAALHGRYSGQWIVDGLPRQGMFMTIGELPPDRNFVFLALFTYLDGTPTWVVGNTDFPIGAHAVTVNLWTLEGGEHFTEPLGSYQREEVTQTLLGTMTIQPKHCNVVDADIDFSATGYGQVSRRFERLVRIGGYDCDQTR